MYVHPELTIAPPGGLIAVIPVPDAAPAVPTPAPDIVPDVSAAHAESLPKEEMLALGSLSLAQPLGTNAKGAEVYCRYDLAQPGRVFLGRIAQNQATRDSTMHITDAAIYRGQRSYKHAS